MSAATTQFRRPTVAVVGGGLAGLAAAVAASQQGLHVEVFERRKYLGGRASSFRDPLTGQLVDDGQHASMGCCTNLADFCRRTGVADCWQRYRTPHFFDFIGPRPAQYDFAPSSWLPAPLHLAPALMRLGYLSIGERWAIGRAMLRLARAKLGNPGAEETIGGWLRRQGQSERAIKLFWSVILVGALSEPVERISLAAARKVFVDGFLAAPTAYQLEVPKIPLAEVSGRVADWLKKRGVFVHRGTPVRQIDGNVRQATGVVLRDGRRREFDFVVVAVPWHRIRALFSETMLAAMPALKGVAEIPPAPITTVHLWLDRSITHLPHAVLLGRLGQWVFNHGRQDRSSAASEPWHYYQVVINALRGPAGRKPAEVVAEVRGDLEAVWPEAREARLLHWRLVSRPAAVFACRPGLDRLRPAQQTPIGNLMLAGDWTATGWPATMEGAVRSGYLAAHAVLRTLGKEKPLLVPDLPRGRLARLLLGLADNTP
jgi:squalene-associated FAD-dependent desaturase